MPRWRHSFGVVWGFGALAVALPAASQITRLGSEFLVPAYTSGDQRAGVVAIDDDGDFVVVWDDFGRDQSSHGIFARRFNSLGNPLGNDFQVNSYTLLAQTYPDIAMAADGDFVVVWTSSGQDGDENGVFGRRFTSSGTPLATEFRANAYTPDNQTNAAVAMGADGSFAVVWNVESFPGVGSGIFGRRFNSSGTSLGGDFDVDGGDGNEGTPDIDIAPTANFVVAWHDYGQDGASNGIFARHFNSVGEGIGGEFQVNTYTQGSQTAARVAMDGVGNFAIAFASYRDGSLSGVFARRFVSTGEALGGEFQVNVRTQYTQVSPAIAMRDDGGFVVAWESFQQDASSFAVLTRRFNTTGVAVGREFQVNTYTPNAQASASVAVVEGGRFVIAWSSYLGQDGDQTGVFAQRFQTPLAILDVDGSGDVAPLTDGLLILRFLFGFTDATLVGGAVDLLNCRRCESAEIVGYLQGLDALDIDDDGETEALIDGLLCLRFLFGFTGNTLVTGAFDAVNCGRCDAPAIEGHLKTLL